MGIQQGEEFTNVASAYTLDVLGFWDARISSWMPGHSLPAYQGLHDQQIKFISTASQLHTANAHHHDK